MKEKGGAFSCTTLNHTLGRKSGLLFREWAGIGGTMRVSHLTSIALGLLAVSSIPANEPLDEVRAVALARLALAGIDKEFPNKPGDVIEKAEDLRTPRAMHPAFYGSFDWHSSVHGHWMLVRLLRLFPGIQNAAEIRSRLDAHLSAENLRIETDYFDEKKNRGFERMYGWAWALRFAAELRSWDDPDAARWVANFAPLETKLVAQTRDYLPRLTYPIRTGVHPDTAFALGQILDYARVAKDEELAALIEKRAREYFLNDRDYPASFEPSGEDFFSPGLNEADLMRRVLSAEAFESWLDGFLPRLAQGLSAAWATPAEVSDLSDPRIVHLVGLNLSRAWTMSGIASALPVGDARWQLLDTAAKAHTAAGLRYVFSGHYEGEHWLGTFAVYHPTGTGGERK